MKVFYSNEPRDDDNIENKSIFLAGPTLRGEDKLHYHNWREDALAYLEKIGYDGKVYVPTPMSDSYSEQIDWEAYHLEKAKCILFWVPRDLKMLPGFTTNIEFGEWLRSGKIVFGAPKDAKKVNYMLYRAEKYGVPIANTLEKTLDNAIKMVS